MHFSNGDHLVIRRAELSDCATIVRFIRELARYERLEQHVVATEARVNRSLFGPRSVAESLIAEWDSEPVGFALYFSNYSTFLAQPGIYLEDLYVTEPMRGKGIGKALLRQVAEVAVRRRCGRLEWSVLDWNQPAIDFYRSLGAEAMDAWTVFRISGPQLIELAGTSHSAGNAQ